jgi:hypothetical protein
MTAEVMISDELVAALLSRGCPEEKVSAVLDTPDHDVSGSKGFTAGHWLRMFTGGRWEPPFFYILKRMEVNESSICVFWYFVNIFLSIYCALF